MTSCGSYLRPDKKDHEAEKLQLRKENFKCLDEIPDALLKFVKGEGQEAEIRQGANCLNNVLHDFGSKTKGSKTDAYTGDDLKSFLNFLYFKEDPIESETILEFLKLKQYLVGGSNQEITQIELDNIVQFVNFTADRMIVIRDIMGLLSLNKVWHKNHPDLNLKIIDEGLSLIRRELKSWVSKTQLTQFNLGPEDFSNLYKLLTDRNKRTEDRKARKVNVLDDVVELFSERESTWYDFIESTYRIIEGPSKINSLDGWIGLIDSISNLYDPMLKLYFLVPANSWKEPTHIHVVKDIVRGVLSFFNGTPSISTLGQIEFIHINRLIDSFYSKFPDTVHLSKTTIKEAVQKIVNNILTPPQRPDRDEQKALNRDHLRTASSEIESWFAVQDFIQQSFFQISIDEMQLTLDVAEPQLKVGDLVTRLDVVLKQSDLKPLARRGLVEFREILDRHRPAIVSSKGLLHIDRQLDKINISWKGLSFLNLMRGLSRLFFLGYGRGGLLLEQGNFLELENMVKWYADFSKIGNEIHAFDPRNLNSGARSFKEADIFGFYSNGDQRLSFYEFYEFLTTTVSAGLNGVARVREVIQGAGCALPELDVFQNYWFKEDCFKHMLKTRFREIYPNLTELGFFMEKLTDPEWENFYHSLMAGARFTPELRGKIETGDLRMMTMMFHYTEKLFVMFDQNSDGFFSVDEIKVATPRFLEIIKKVTDVRDPDYLTYGFAYLVVENIIPEGFVGKSKFYIWMKEHEWGWSNPVARRENVYRVFDVLKSQLK